MQASKLKILIITYLILLTGSTLVHGQACSDAGLCTVSAPSDTLAEQIEIRLLLSTPAGLGEQFVRILNPAAEVEMRLRNWLVSVKMPWQHTSLSGLSASGWGDFSMRLVRSIDWKEHRMQASLGLKLPTGKTNIQSEGIKLPMAFQSGLGSTDLIAGLSMHLESGWDLATAVQLPVKQDNRNAYLGERIASNGEDYQFFISRRVQRAADVMLRVEHRFSGKKVSYRAGLITLYHLGNDTYLDTDGNRKQLKGSEGLTLNLSGALHLPLSNGIALDLAMGFPVLARAERPEGLTRNGMIVPTLYIPL